MAIKQEKIRAIINGTANELFFKDVADGKVKSEDYGSYWKDITFDEIKASAAIEGIPPTVYFGESGLEDGMHLFESDGHWILYRIDGSTKFSEQKYKTKQEALARLLEMIASSFIAM